MHVFISTHIRTQPRNPAETENIHVCMYTYIHAKQNPAQTRKARAQGERTGKGKGWLRFGPASETVQQNGARTRDLCGVSRAASTGHSGQIPRGGRTGRLELRARRRFVLQPPAECAHHAHAHANFVPPTRNHCHIWQHSQTMSLELWPHAHGHASFIHATPKSCHLIQQLTKT
jgi:hypothetical protein